MLLPFHHDIMDIYSEEVNRLSRIININQDWQFTQASCSMEALSTCSMETVNIPHTWNGLDGQDGGNDYYRGQCWYKKSFVVDKADGERVYIEMGAVNSVANVYVNGVHLGEHRGGYSLFRFDMTDHVRTGENELIVSADNSPFEDVYPLFADFTFYGGIYRDVNIVVTPAVHLDRLDMGSSGVYVSQKSINDDRAALEVRARVRNAGQPVEAVCSVQFLDAEGQVVVSGQHAASVEGVDDIALSLVVDNPHLWNGVYDPYLYDCQVQLLVGDQVMDTIKIPTGLRYCVFDGDKGFILNGQPMRLNGVSRHQDRETVGNALTPAHQQEDMALIQELGANSIRLAHYQHNAYFYDLCDQAGMVVWAEIPYISRTSSVEDYAANAISQMRELIRQNYNHASILMWGVQNEIGIFPDEKPLHEIVHTINAVAKEEDPYRATTQAQVMMINETDPANWETDVVAFNQYHGWYVGETGGFDQFIRTFREANPDKCLGYSEYGAEGILQWHTDDPKVKDYTEEYHALYHEQVMTIFNRYDFIWGTYVWNMFDFGSDMRDEGGVKGRNNKGLVTFDRSIKKDAYYFYQSLWSKKKMLYIASKRFKDRHTKMIQVKVYSNMGTVELSVNGKVVEQQTRDDNVFVFDVKLKRGTNTITATAGALTDTAEFVRVKKANPDYILPESEKKKGLNLDMGSNVRNWFEDEDVEVGELQFPEGCLSIRNTVKEIMAVPEGEAFMKQYFEEMVNHSMFKMLSKMPLEKLFGFRPEMFPENVVFMINHKLNQIQM